MPLEMKCLIDFIECLEEQQTVVHTCVTVVFQEIAGMFQSVECVNRLWKLTLRYVMLCLRR